MNRVALNTFSFFDSGKAPSAETEPERFYHGFVLGLMVDLKERYVITSNRESGFGRYDLMLDRAGGRMMRSSWSLGLDPYEERTLNDTMQSALLQIRKKRYEAALEEKGIPSKKNQKVWFRFSGKEGIDRKGVAPERSWGRELEGNTGRNGSNKISQDRSSAEDGLLSVLTGSFRSSPRKPAGTNFPRKKEING